MGAAMTLLRSWCGPIFIYSDVRLLKCILHGSWKKTRGTDGTLMDPRVKGKITANNRFG
jgi:hypothetical protein